MNTEGAGIVLHLQAMTPLFTGSIADETAIPNRQDAWFNWIQTPAHNKLRETCGEGGSASISAYYPGKEVFIPKEEDPDAIRVVFPPNLGAKVPKGLLARLHLLVLMERVERTGIDPATVIFACIDGSGAFKFDSLQLLIDRFKEDSSVDVVFGRRPKANPGMPLGRKVIEEFEQYLLFRHRSQQLKHTFPTYDLAKSILPDGQAGCWAFRLNVGLRLQLAASGYEIEFDLLSSSLDAGLKACYSEPLLMSNAPRAKSLASQTAIPMSIQKLKFIERRLRISRDDIAEGWAAFAAFAKDSADSDLLKAAFAEDFADLRQDSEWGILPAYEKAVIEYCTAKR
jgi:hypothetical protein